jgi:hypothetical protein
MHLPLKACGLAHNDLFKKLKNITARASYRSLCLFFVGTLRKACASASDP